MEALASKTRPQGLPKGYLSLEEFSKKYPDFYTEFHTKMSRDKPMRIWIDEDEPVYATIMEKVEVVLNEEDKKKRREILSNVKFNMEEDRYRTKLVVIPPREEYEITVAKFIFMFEDPNWRLDADTMPPELQFKQNRWDQFKVLCLDKFRRNPACAEHDEYTGNGTVHVPSRYKKDEFNPNNTKLGLWGVIPPVYILHPDNYGFTLKQERKIEDYVRDVMIECEIEIGKAVQAYKNEELEALKAALVGKGIINEYSDLTFIRSLIKAAQTKHSKTEIPTEV